jgi:hypothetical protein
VAEVRAQIAEHGYVERSEGVGYPGIIVPPDFGPHGPSEQDFDLELEKILRKIQRLKNPGGEED